MLQQAILMAQELDYRRLRLDTLAQMTSAQKLYPFYGFNEILPYRFNPVDGTIYMEKELI